MDILVLYIDNGATTGNGLAIVIWQLRDKVAAKEETSPACFGWTYSVLERDLVNPHRNLVNFYLLKSS